MTPTAYLTPVLARRVAALVAHFEGVQSTRMQGVSLLNPALAVEAVGFEATPADPTCGDDAWAEGVLITPWFMSLVRLPVCVLPHGHRVGVRQVRDFGAERFDFLGAHDPVIGYHETCALFSPMGGFASQVLARETAQAVLTLVRTPEAPPAQVVAPVHPMPARRSFLMGRLNTSRAAA
jgi:[NiFe] hydrogenase assembly HybE family chaperone